MARSAVKKRSMKKRKPKNALLAVIATGTDEQPADPGRLRERVVLSGRQKLKKRPRRSNRGLREAVERFDRLDSFVGPELDAGIAESGSASAFA